MLEKQPKLFVQGYNLKVHDEIKHTRKHRATNVTNYITCKSGFVWRNKQKPQWAIVTFGEIHILLKEYNNYIEEQGREWRIKGVAMAQWVNRLRNNLLHKSATITFIVWNFWSPTPSVAGWQAGRQTKCRWILKYLKLAVGRNIWLVGLFNKGTASLQPYQCIPAGFPGKACCKFDFKSGIYLEAIWFPTNPYY